MTAAITTDARPEPSRHRFTRALRRAPMFRNRTNAIATTVVGGLLTYLAVRVFEWAVVHAIWTFADLRKPLVTAAPTAGKAAAKSAAKAASTGEMKGHKKSR